MNTSMNINNPKVYSLTRDQIEKIFPDSYYQKYASHLKILQFEKLIVEQQAKKTHIKFKERKSSSTSRIKSAIPKQQTKRVKINNYDTFQDTIQKNKQQLKRMSKYNKILALKMKTTPEKRNVIRSPSKLDNMIQDSVLLEMKNVQDMEYERRQRLKNLFKIKLQKQSVCRFIKKKCQSAQSTYRKNVCNPQTTAERSKTQRELALKLQQIAMSSLQKNKAVSMMGSKKIEKNASFILNLNTAIKNSHKTLQHSGMTQRQQQKVFKIFKSRTFSKTALGLKLGDANKEKRDLILQTKRLKQEVMSMPTLRRCDMQRPQTVHVEDLDA